MNRLVIIGNGFDLAHGLPTSYKDFIDDFWRNFKDKCKSEEYQKLILTNDAYDGYYLGYKSIENFNDLKSNLSEYCLEYSYQFNEVDLNVLTKSGGTVIKIFGFINYFFKIINVKNSQNWVDIENEYYRELKKIVNSKCPDVTKSREYWIKEQKIQVTKLNYEFEQVKNLLEKYLIEKVLEKFNLGFYPDGNGDIFKFLNILKPISVIGNELNLFKELPKDVHDEIEIQFDEERKERKEKKSLFVLNFNYTSTVLRYLISQSADENSSKIHIPIHGILGNKLDNKINFGFGDEMDDDYKMIENIDDNEYLRNFKSFQYLQNSNYKKLLDFVESDQKFQVFIMGHSCGLSDRTLLNTVFEHENCRSIKVFYHQREDGTDNYTEIVQNISRHFNKKALMREKIVNKTLCQPLPQIQLPLK